ncbi:MAG: Exonuclease RNase T and DNA polymerase III [Candidatus Moranbacteria bacterium GW2011_GWA2_39_41]|nr:MAG: Exonuclease RNase T and DNA polymerase III [Candidatus Moranbacteria bacterium GW2011_GWA2_39_41]
MNKSNLVFLDTETTGIGADGRLCQLAYSFSGKESEALFKPPVPIEIEAMSVTHITNKMVADKEPFDGSQMKKEVESIFLGDNILVAHNAQFDAGILKRENIEIKNIIDTLKIAQHLDVDGEIPKYNLQYLRYYFDLEVTEACAHDALGDVRVLERLFERYFQQMLIDFGTEEKVLQEMMEISARPVLIKKFNFGKYIGEKVSEVAKKDSGYLAWLFNQKVMARENGLENDENWIFTLDKYLNPNKLF